MAQPSNSVVGLRTSNDGPLEQALYEVRKAIHPRAVHGWFAAWRWLLVWATQLVFYGTAWLQWNGRQAVLFDVAHRKFYIFGLVFWPQDVIYLTVLLIIAALSLFLFTAVAGRLWCGYACPQTVYTEIFMWIERKIEGDRNARIRLDSEPLFAQKVRPEGGKARRLDRARAVDRLHLRRLLSRRSASSGARCLDASPTGAVGNLLDPVLRLRHLRQRGLDARAGLHLHVPLRALPERDVRQGHADHHLRQGARRAARARTRVKGKAEGLGDCVDCNICVQVCPTGIDIRDGPAVPVHRLRRLHRRLQPGDGEGGPAEGPDPLLDHARARAEAHARADVPARAPAARARLHGDRLGRHRRRVRRAVPARAAQGGRDPRPRRRSRARSRAGRSRTSTACR